jgi:D-3-phosphoglycerate dehydrogenase
MFINKKCNILLTEAIHQSAVTYFKEMGYHNIDYYKRALTQQELKDAIGKYHFIGIRSKTHLSKELLSQAGNLLTIGCFSIGTDQVDLATAKMLGIPVFNAPYSNTRSVAELVISESIMLMRGIPEKNKKAHLGRWDKSAKDAYEIRGKTLGIVGYGHIGSQVSIIAEALGMEVIYFDIAKKLSLGRAVPCKSLHELLKLSDIVTLHVPSNDQTHNMIGDKEFGMMKTNACFINAARGDVVDYQALVKYLERSHIKGAAIDVFPKEPASKDQEFICALRGFDNVILTPHIGGSTIEAQANIGLEVAEKLVKFSQTGATVGATNFVEVDLLPNETYSRYIHIHKNVPDVLRQVNQVFTSKKINIASVSLQTDPEIGYVILDAETKPDEAIVKEMQEIPYTIKSRLVY